MAKGLFVAGTGTDVGKTFVTALMIKKLIHSGRKAAYYKAAMSGNQRISKSDFEYSARGKDRNRSYPVSDEYYVKEKTLIPGDAVYVKNVSGLSQSLESMCPYVYEKAVSPHLAARLERNPVELVRVCDGFEELSRSNEYITVEGSGGIVCPVRFDLEKGGNIMLEDVIKKLNLPCVIVADAGLGTINSVVLTAEYMKSHAIKAKGIIFNRFHPGDVMEEDNLNMCEHITGIKVISCVKEGDLSLDMDEYILESLYE